MVIEHSERRNTERITGVPNVTFDLTAVLHNTLEAIAAHAVSKQDRKRRGTATGRGVL